MNFEFLQKMADLYAVLSVLGEFEAKIEKGGVWPTFCEICLNFRKIGEIYELTTENREKMALEGVLRRFRPKNGLKMA